MSVGVLSNYPLSRDFKNRLLDEFGDEPEYVDLGRLRDGSILRMLPKLWRIAPDRLVVALEDPTSFALLPILKIIAAMTRARGLSVVNHKFEFERFGRLSVVGSFFALVGASLAGQFHLRSATSAARRLLSRPRPSVAIGDGGVLYLNANLWFGVKAGGSVGHISGVANGLMDLGLGLDFASVGGRLLVDDRAKFIDLPAPGAYGLPFEVNYFRFNSAVIAMLRREYQQFPPRFIYQRLSISNFAGAALAENLGIPLVTEYNGSEVWIAKHWGRPLRYQDAASAAEDAMLKRSDLVVTVSDALGDQLVEAGIDRDRIVVYPNCIDPEMFDPDRHGEAEKMALRDRLEIAHDAKVAMFIGTFGQWHGVDVLARAVRQLCVDDRGWVDANKLHFVIVGDGLKMQEVRDTLSHPSCDGIYTLTGLVPQRDAPSYLAMADMLLSPHVPNADGSPFFGSPTKLFEYMAMGKPIVASDLDQIGEVLRNSIRADSPVLPAIDGELAVLAAPGNVGSLVDGIRLVVDNLNAARKLGINARREALSRYTWQHHVNAILQGLNRVVG